MKTKAVKIVALKTERFKRVTVVQLSPTENGLTVIGGKNAQGKTSVIDSIVYALGGEKHRPSDAQNRTTEGPPAIRLELSNGLIVERKGKNSSLHVTDATGMAGNQTVLNKFVEQLALDLPAFMAATAKAKAEILLKIIGVGDELEEFDKAIAVAFSKRRDENRDHEALESQMAGMEVFPDAPDELVVLADIAEQIRAAEEARALHERITFDIQGFTGSVATVEDDIAKLQNHILVQRDAWNRELNGMNSVVSEAKAERQKAQDHLATITVPDIDQLQSQLMEAEGVNSQVRANKVAKLKKLEVAESQKLVEATNLILQTARVDKAKLLTNAEMPLPGLSVVEGELTYNDSKWDCMSKSERLKVAVGIIRQLKPECGFVLMDDLESMDIDTMMEFGQWVAGEGLQIIATRVSTGDECSIIIEDGERVGLC